jgi:hypothetical protein
MKLMKKYANAAAKKVSNGGMHSAHQITSNNPSTLIGGIKS